MVRPPVAEQVQVNFRMPVDLRDRIKAAADKNGRSMNAEIIRALELIFAPEESSIEDSSRPKFTRYNDPRLDSMMEEIDAVVRRHSLEKWNK